MENVSGKGLGDEQLVSQQAPASGLRGLLSNKGLHPTSLPSLACFNRKGRLVGSAAGEPGCWAAGIDSQ